MTNKGKFFVIDGTDGSGKGTQTKLIIEKLQNEGYNVLEADFPQYGQKSAALVEEYLNGKFGDFDEVDAYQASIFYACDRFSASKEMKEHLQNGGIIISNRYVSSNMIHQSSKIENKQELDKFLSWLENLEFNIFKIPKPNKVFFLNVPYEIGQQLCKKKSLREYIENDQNTDIHESSKDHMRQAYNRAVSLIDKYPYWNEIKCAPQNNLRTIEEINEELYIKIKEELNKQETTQLKIYFIGSIRGGRDNVQIYNQIIKFLSQNNNIVLGRQVGDTCITHLGERTLTNEQIYERAMRNIFNADLIIADVTTPSLGVGHNITKAIEQNKPVLCLYCKETPKELSAIMQASPINTNSYTTLQEAKQIISEFIQKHQKQNTKKNIIEQNN
jgi:dTMP kinase